ncbi:MAG: hypothetical protein LBI43_06710 [Streptococcaceae bacterium]|jgi:hypothetical protein|nr:hypothetical protein [Streptococcaceae bacterium]
MKMMTTTQMSQEEAHDFEIWEAISLEKDLPIPKKKVMYLLDELIKNQRGIIDENEISEYEKARKMVAEMDEEKVKDLTLQVANFYRDSDFDL